jgi:hypothetical protein
MSQRIGVLQFCLCLMRLARLGSTSELVSLCPPPLFGRSWDDLQAHLITSFSKTMISQNHGHRHPLVGLATPEALRQHRALLTRYRQGMQKEDGGELFNYLWVFFL